MPADAAGTGGVMIMKAISITPRSGQRGTGRSAVVLLHGHQLERSLARAVTAEAVGTFVLVLAITSTVVATLSQPIAGAPYGSPGSARRRLHPRAARRGTCPTSTALPTTSACRCSPNAGALDRDKQRSRGLRTMTCRPHGQRMTVHFETDPGRPRWPLTSWPTPHARRRRRSRCARPGQGRRCGSGKTRERVST